MTNWDPPPEPASEDDECRHDYERPWFRTPRCVYCGHRETLAENVEALRKIGGDLGRAIYADRFSLLRFMAAVWVAVLIVALFVEMFS